MNMRMFVCVHARAYMWYHTQCKDLTVGREQKNVGMRRAAKGYVGEGTEGAKRG